MTRPDTLRAAILRRVAREGDWMESPDLYLAFDIENEADDRKRHNLFSVTLSRLHRSGLLEVDKSRSPWAYRISTAGRAELAVLSDPAAYRRHLEERMRVLQAQRWPKQEAA